MAGQSDPHLPLFSAEEGDYGPFFPQMVTQVPTWLAIALKKRGKCAIRPPSWMSVESLTRILESEREFQEEFKVLPFHYVEISRLLFDHARDDIPDIYMVRSLIEDIRDVRFHKVETSLEFFEDARSSAVRIKNLSAMEVTIVRPFVGRALQAFYEHGRPDLILNPERLSNSNTNRWQQAPDQGQRRPLRKR